MSDYVPTDSESEQETRDTTHSPDRPQPRPPPRQTQSQRSQAGPIRGSTPRAGRQPAQWIPPLRGSVAAAARAAAAASRRATSTTPAPTQQVRPVRAAAVPTFGSTPGPDRRTVLTSETLVDPEEVQVTAFEGFPNGIINMDHVDDPLDDEFVQELEGLFELRRGYARVGESLAYVAPPRQYAIHLYSQLAILQAIERSRSEILAAPRAPAAPGVTPADQARSFPYAPVFKDFVKRQARELLMSKNLKVYGSDVPRGSPATLKSLLVLVLDHINGQPASFKRDYLPRGYADGDPGAVASVDSLVRSKLRKSRGIMRDLMRTSMTPTLPNSTALVAANTQEARGHQTHLKARLAYLRILTIFHWVARGPRDAGRQWRNIDEHLRHLDGMGRSYRTAFFRLILRLDRALFNGEQFFAGMDTNTIKLPTDQEVESLMETSGDNGDDAELDDATLAGP
ncbi:uncharacterized protein PGTG_10379 [Puccinia graminis f. sp. tritici CRL 75-36-700-3]|uniref:Uncharacterized protein n=1 Tax=Puccinia graminis f. sp. tritici (strain CRL 75-36-700-3 / race SCCL) TaxID=418459 RepID=E3KKT3_PUCGT|nr:uncharacterized protein PGTG_10379 [Puccinia graminis f. sp. tritici CRL 75-36-700-3]EFP84908.1 hypothetical protein PGTG_10379 [Puccinia graminis f. sp. tritici CRL 75-36-700-3]